jgi:hypothetical protein
LKLLNFDFNEDPDSTFISNADPISPKNADLVRNPTEEHKILQEREAEDYGDAVLQIWN